MRFGIIKFRVFDRDFKRIMRCKLIVEESDLNNMLRFIESSNNRIIIFDEIRVVDGDLTVQEILKRIKRELDDNFCYLP